MKNSVYFQGLNSLRALAALSVFIGHVELIKYRNNLPNFLSLDYFQHSSGHIGVVLFFVLSGFLITYILLNEQQQNNSISLKDFYLKRILRVWPLYFLIILISIVVFQYYPSISAFILCLFIFPNISHAMDQQWLVSPQIWSIGVEEQFYLFHPLIVILFKKYLFPFLLLFFVFYTFLPQLIVCTFEPSSDTEKFIRNFFYGSKYNCMALGAICSILQLKYSDYLKKIFRHTFFSISLVILTFTFWIFPTPIYLNDTIQICYTKIEVTQEVFSILFGLMILVIINNNFLGKIFTVKILDYFGKISYGFYMFHWFIILIFIKLLLPIFETTDFYANLILYVGSFTVTFLISMFSFNYFERIFLNLRNKLVKH